MKKVIIEEIELENFKIYQERTSIKLDNKLLLIVGPNAIGKTTLLDSLLFSFYGVTSNGLKGDEVVNNIINKNCFTSVKFSVDNDKYRIDRYQKSTKYGNTVFLFKNDMTNAFRKGHKDVSHIIEQLIMPYKLFINTILFSQKVKDFFTDIADSEKKDIFRKILSLDQFVDYDEKTKNKIKELSIDLEKINSDINVLKALLDNNKEIYRELENKKIIFENEKEKNIKNIKSEIEDFKTKKNKIEMDLKNEKNNINNEEEIKKLIDQLSKEELDLEKEYANIKNTFNEEKFKSLKYTQDKYNIELNNVNEQYDNSIKKIKESIYNEENNINNEIKIIKNNINKLTNEKNNILPIIIKLKSEIENLSSSKKNNIDICPLCKQEIDKEIKNHIEETIKLKTIEFNNSEPSIKIINEKLIILAQDEEKLNSELFKLKKDLKKEEETFLLIRDKSKIELFKISEDVKKEVEKTYNTLIEENSKEVAHKIIKIKEEINKNKNILLNTIEKKELIKKLEKDIFEISIYINNCSKRLIELNESFFDNSHIEKIKNEINDIIIKGKAKTSEKFFVERKINILEFWRKAFSSSGIPSMLIDEAIPFMNDRVNYYLDLIGNGRYVVSFDTLQATKKGEYRDKISVNVIDTQSKANTRLQLSGGQTRIIDIATILTLNDLQSNIQDFYCNILLFDEIFDSLDDENIGYVSKLLKHISKEKCIFLISHRPINQIEYDEILRLN